MSISSVSSSSDLSALYASLLTDTSSVTSTTVSDSTTSSDSTDTTLDSAVSVKFSTNQALVNQLTALSTGTVDTYSGMNGVFQSMLNVRSNLIAAVLANLGSASSDTSSTTTSSAGSTSSSTSTKSVDITA
ncbi:TPA: hypothetical protein DDW35_08395 [Candidatus Sumerlaeota bacterium]|nr:hypothetical protein [Candidatus Sumerlaeota bacterium]